MSFQCLANCRVTPVPPPDRMGALDRHELDRVLVAVLDARRPVVLPPWSYRRWCLMLQYPDLSPRAQETTRMLGREREAVLTQPGVRALIDWAGRRRRLEPAAAAAAALVELRRAQVARTSVPLDRVLLADGIVAAIDGAQPLVVVNRHRSRLLVDADRLADIEVDPPRGENPHLSGAVAGLLDLTGMVVEEQLVARVEDAVVQAADWWACHPCPAPEDENGPALPGIALAQTLPVSERLSTLLTDPGMRRLVAGPRPGCKRPCQLAWRRGLTYWVAAWLSNETDPPYPGPGVYSWWQRQLTHLSLATASQQRTSRGSGCRGTKCRRVGEAGS